MTEPRLDKKNLKQALAHLSAACPRMAQAIDELGPPEIRKREGGFAGLLRILVEQQVSVAAGRAIWARIEAGGATSPDVVLARDEEALKALGLFRPKARYAKAVAEAEQNGALCFKRQKSLPLDEALAELTAIKGVGPWTASIYQMFCVGRPDLAPAGDIALREAAGRLYQTPERPSEAEFDQLTARFAPWRSAAALMFWRYYAATKKREGVT